MDPAVSSSSNLSLSPDPPGLSTGSVSTWQMGIDRNLIKPFPRSAGSSWNNLEGAFRERFYNPREQLMVKAVLKGSASPMARALQLKSSVCSKLLHFNSPSSTESPLH